MAGLRPAVGKIAGLDKRRGAACPMVLGIRQSDLLEDGREIGVVSVHVPDGYNPALRRRPGTRPRHEDQEHAHPEEEHSPRKSHFGGGSPSYQSIL